MEYTMESEWYTGGVLLPTYELAELLGTKMRALYQRRKGRDLFDIWYAITQTNVDPISIIKAWKFYMEHEDNTVSQQDFLDNIQRKVVDPDFVADMRGLLRPNVTYDISKAFELVRTALLEKI